MKNVLLIAIFAITTFFVSAQSRQDQTLVLQLCVDLPELTPFYPVDGQNNPLQLNVVEYHPVIFPVDLPVTHAGKSLQFLSPSEVATSNSLAWFHFKKFEILGNSASVNFDFHYYTGKEQKTLLLKLVFMREGSGWKRSEISIN
jgi:hypothetical protein